MRYNEGLRSLYQPGQISLDIKATTIRRTPALSFLLKLFKFSRCEDTKVKRTRQDKWGDFKGLFRATVGKLVVRHLPKVS